MIDDAYLNGYAKLFPVSVSVVYVSLCRHADKEQVSFPSQILIAEEHNIDERTVRRAINTLIKAGLISLNRVRNNKGMWLNNTYTLLDKSVWLSKEEILLRGLGKKSRGHQSPMDIQRTIKTSSRGHQTPTKDTHTKDTHTLYREAKKFSSLKEITEEDMEEISNRYKIPLGMVRLSYEKLVNYCESKGKRYKNYKAALRNFVLGDAKKEIERRQYDSNKHGIDARNIQ